MTARKERLKNYLEFLWVITEIRSRIAWLDEGNIKLQVKLDMLSLGVTVV